jgi:hypothetical protein
VQELQHVGQPCNSCVVMKMPIPNRLRLPVTVLLERRIISHSFWTLPSWYLHTVAVGDHLVTGTALRQVGLQTTPDTTASSGRATGSRVCIAAGSTDKGELFAWTGFHVTLYKDACERYWHALIGDKPLIYVVCRDKVDTMDDAVRTVNGSCEPAMTIQPGFVSIDYDEAVAAVETDALVLSTLIPLELYRYMEDFVLQHYQPAQLKKRKRKNWSDTPSGPTAVAGLAPGLVPPDTVAAKAADLNEDPSAVESPRAGSNGSQHSDRGRSGDLLSARRAGEESGKSHE